MNLTMIRHLVRRAFELPPHVAAVKAVRLTGRIARDRAGRARDRLQPSYGPGVGSLHRMSLAIDLDVIGESERETLRRFGEMYLAHHFDILGSGWRDVGYGAEADGIEGVRYAPDAEARRIAVSGDLTQLVTRANRATAQRIYALISDRQYRPIDWQRDIRSGFRWSAATNWKAIRIGLDRGADVKVPRELGRMQHLPQLALMACLAASNPGRFRPPAVYVAEIRNQVLDFIASNPPRYGACWGCAMDVGIRVANWTVALGMLEGAGLELDEPFRAVLGRSVHDHARHIAANLEWSETGRSNHYLSDIVGLLYAAAVLPRSEETINWLNFAGREILSETWLQFHPDGGNYEGSSSYHRLSGELSVFGVAMVAGLARHEPEFFAASAPCEVGNVRPPHPFRNAPIERLLQDVTPRFEAMRAFSEAIRRPDGRLIQLGDTDSGRLFKLVPAATNPVDSVTAPVEDHLRIDDLSAALRIMLAGEATGPGDGVAAGVVRALMGGGTDLVRSDRSAEDPAALPSEPLDDIELRLRSLPEKATRLRTFPLPPLAETTKRDFALAAFSDFGLYVISDQDVYLAFRCASHHRRDAPSGHTHDDNLSIELFMAGESVISDPGTYVYTSLPEWRNAYRHASAHFVPRADTWDAVAYTDYLFELKHLAVARCLHASPQGLAGMLEGPRGRVYRLIKIENDAITVLDAVDGGKLCAVAESVMRCDGYGKKTSNRAFDA